MDLPQDYISKLQPTKRQAGEPRSGWEEQLGRFSQRLNPERERAGFRPYTPERIGKLLANYGVHDEGAAAAFYKKLDTEAKTFGALFNKLTSQKSIIGVNGLMAGPVPPQDGLRGHPMEVRGVSP